MTSIVYILADKDTLFLKNNTLMALSSSIYVYFCATIFSTESCK